MAADGESSTGQSPRVIKRYSNRKLYDTSDSRYVTLPQIGQMVQRGEHVQIIDNRTKEDKTEATLALILSEDLKSKQRTVPLGTLRTLIQQRGERLLESLRDSPVGRLIPATDGEAGAAKQSATAVEDAGEEAAAAQGEGGSGTDRSATRARLDELVETSRHTLDQLQERLDERVRAVVPLVGPVRELREELGRLRARIEAIEAKVGIAHDEPES